MNKLTLVSSVAVLATFVLGCGASTTSKLQDSVVATSTHGKTQSSSNTSSTATPQVEITYADPTATNVSVASPVAKPTSIPIPTEAPIAEAKKLELGESGFGQGDQSVGWAFLIKNSNADQAVENSQYQVAIYDKDGAVLKTDSGYIEIMLPGQTLGIAGDVFLEKGQTASKLEVQISQGKASAMKPVPDFSVGQVNFIQGKYSSSAMALVSNPFKRDLTRLRVSSIAFDNAGKIIGGGYTYLNFILSESTTAVKVPVKSAGEVAKVILYPTFSGLSSIKSGDDRPKNIEAIKINKFGFGQERINAGYGLLVENPNEGVSVERSEYHITAYTRDGSIVAVEEGYIEVILPKQKLGVGGSFYLDEGVIADKIDVQVLSGEYVKSDPVPPFTAENVTLLPGSYSTKVTGQIVNPYKKDISNLRVSAIAYDSEGNIVGGGSSYADFVPANGKAAVEVSVEGTQKMASAELYATLSALSDIKK
jgi:hypothetical protein